MKDKEEDYSGKMRKKELKLGKGSLGYQERYGRLSNYIWEVGGELKMVRELNKEEVWEEKDENIKAQKKNTWETLKKVVKNKER